MNLKKTFLAVLVIGSSTYLSGCIGKSESECPGIENGVICKGPREVMELTNNRDDLTDMIGEENEKGKSSMTVADSQYPAQIVPPGDVKYPKSTTLVNQPIKVATQSTVASPCITTPQHTSPATITSVCQPNTLIGYTQSSNALGTSAIQPRPIAVAPAANQKTGSPFNHAPVVAANQQVYSPNSDIPRSKYLYSTYNGQPVNPSLSAGQVQQYRNQGYKQAVTAPEPLAMLQQGKVMRITFAPYTDDNNALNLPGFVYVNVKPQTWIAGNNATANPARIVPLEVQDAARENMQQQQRAEKGVSSSGIIRDL